MALIMPEDNDITRWLPKLAEGDQRAAEEIWRGSIDKLMRLARNRLAGLPRRSADEEDIVVTAMKSFFRGVEAGRFSKLRSRDDFWKVLYTITARKVVALQRCQLAAKRGSGQVRGESVFAQLDADGDEGIARITAEEPSPEMAAEMAEMCRTLLDQLGDDTLKTITIMRLEGFTNNEIAEKLDRTPRSIERKLQRIRNIWSAQELP